MWISVHHSLSDKFETMLIASFLEKKKSQHTKKDVKWQQQQKKGKKGQCEFNFGVQPSWQDLNELKTK